MSQISRRGVLLGSVAVTMTSSGLLIAMQPADAFSLKGLVSSVGNLGAAVVHGVTAVAQGAAHVIQTVPQLVATAAHAAADIVGAAVPVAAQLVSLEQQVAHVAQQVVQQIPILCNPNASSNPITMISGIASQAVQLGGIAQQAIMQNPTQFLTNNGQDLVNHLIQYLLQGSRRMVETSLEAVALCGASPLSDTFAPVPSPSEHGFLDSSP
jgi:hypothetical protein